MGLTILKTKLVKPFINPDIVLRPRLTDRIEAGIQAGHKLVLAAAPAGFGKSTAVSIWTGQHKHKTAWLSLDENDNDPLVFWTYLIAAVQTAIPGFAENLFPENGETPAVDSIPPVFLNEAVSINEHFSIILDDYHVINSPQIHEALTFLLQQLPNHFHIILTTRADPSLPIARLRAQRTLTELRSDDLRFSPEEVETLFNEIFELGLSSDDLSLLESRTEGWGVGLILAGLTIKGTENRQEFLSAFSGSQQFILEYLIDEVLRQQPADIRDFLLKTSILDRFCANLCDAVVQKEDSHRIIEHLKNNHLFIISLDHEQVWFRYHHLFAELLKSFLENETRGEEIHTLYHHASCWFEEKGQLEQAVRYALNSRDFEHAAVLMEQIVDSIISRGQVNVLLKWLEIVPEQVIRSHPRLMLHQAWTIFLSGRVKPAIGLLNGAQEAINNLPENDEKRLLTGRLYASLATISSITRDIPEAIEKAKISLDTLPEEEHIYRARAGRAMAVAYMFKGDFDTALKTFSSARQDALSGNSRFLAAEILSQTATIRKQQGKYKLAHQIYQDILDLLPESENSPYLCLGYIGLAEIALGQHDLISAENYIKKGIELSLKGKIGYPLQIAYLIYGLIKQMQGDQKAAQVWCQKGEALSQLGGGSLESILGLAYYKVLLYLHTGELQKAQDWADGKSIPEGWSFENLPIVLDEFHQSLLAQVALFKGEFEIVLEIADRIIPQAGEAGRDARVLELSLFKAAALLQKNRQVETLEAFEIAIDLAEPEMLVQLFLSIGQPVFDLLKLSGRDKTNSPFIQSLNSAFASKPGFPREKITDVDQSQLIDPLTERELEILQFLCEGQSNQQIADQLIVSVNTVKKHTSNIYSKLGVKNRTQAILKTDELNLFQ